MNQSLVLQKLTRWAEDQDLIRAMLLYSSRANPTATVDIFSDYDILLVVTDVRRFHQDDRWLADFGEVLVVFRNPIALENGFECFGFITHYRDGTKIDYSFYPVHYLQSAVRQSRLPDDLDHGYRVLLDKDQLTTGLKPPTYSAYLPSKPSEQDYRALIDEFFNDALYAAKNLWRDNLFPFKYNLDYIMKYSCLRKMLEWHIQNEHAWSVKPGAYGKGLKKYVPTRLWSELESTYVGAGISENWAALFRTVDLFRKVALEVAKNLGFSYPLDLDQQVCQRLNEIKKLGLNTNP